MSEIVDKLREELRVAEVINKAKEEKNEDDRSINKERY